MFKIMGSETHLVQVKVHDPGIAQFAQHSLEAGQVFRDGGDFHGEGRNHPGSQSQLVEVIIGGADIKTDLVEPGIGQLTE